MSQGSNYKVQVMEALSNAPTNLISNKAFLWAATNLPDEGGQGIFNKSVKRNFKHETGIGFWEAIGCPKNYAEEVMSIRMKQLMEKFSKQHAEKNPDSGSFFKSEVFEFIIEENDPDVMFFIFALGFMEVYNTMLKASDEVRSKLDELKDMLDKMSSGDLDPSSIEVRAGSSRGSASEVSSEDDIPEDAPEELKAILRSLIALKKRLGGKK